MTAPAPAPTPASSAAADSRLSREEAMQRARIGRDVVYFALYATLFLALAAMIIALGGDKEKAAFAKDILSTVLPLFGTWVGTVMAFYFSRENFATAARETADLVRQLTPEQRLQGIGVGDAMLSMTAADTTQLVLASDAEAAKLNLLTDVIANLLDKFRRNRLPVVDAAGKPLYVIHRSMIDGFLVKSALAGKTLATLTLKDLLDAPDLKAVAMAFTTLARDARLIAAKQAMDGNPNCSDVFVTTDGTRATAAIGWITNVMVREKSQA